jgi:uncharacterized lipoprotein
MRSHSPISRNSISRMSAPRLVIAALVAATLASGCSWFRKDDGVYAQAPESRPLEVPPDLDLPRTEGAVGVPVTASAMAPAASGASAASATAPSGFTVPGSRDDIFNKVGEALAGVEGLTIASRAQLLGAYDVAYEGSNFLVRVSTVESGVYISAVDPRGLPAAGAAPGKVIAALKAKLGAQ